jgi:hypothetical protein
VAGVIHLDRNVMEMIPKDDGSGGRGVRRVWRWDGESDKMTYSLCI